MPSLMGLLAVLWGWIRPRRHEQQTACACEAVDVEIGVSQQRTHRSSDEPNNVEQQKEIDQRHRMLADQKKSEDDAKKSRSFVKNQLARYLHKGSGQWFDSHVVGVHHDDGPNNPYYTIRYESEDGEQIEKQTTGDRLDCVEWDEERSWEILSARLNR